MFFGKGETLYVVLVEKTSLGYRWTPAAGGMDFADKHVKVTRGGSNLRPRNIRSDEDWVSLTHGVIHDDAIEKLIIRYKDQEPKEAVIVETSKGRIWYCFSDTPVN